jgi:hypothetical protein
MNRMTIAALSPILVLFASILHAQGGASLEGEWVVVSVSDPANSHTGNKLTIRNEGGNWHIYGRNVGRHHGWSGGPNRITSSYVATMEDYDNAWFPSGASRGPESVYRQFAASGQNSVSKTIQLSNDGRFADYTTEQSGGGPFQAENGLWYQVAPLNFSERLARVSAAGPSQESSGRLSATGDQNTASQSVPLTRKGKIGQDTSAGQRRASTPKEEADLRMQLALALAEKGDQQGSVKELNAALKLDPNSPRQKEVYAAWNHSSGGIENRASANQSMPVGASSDEAEKAGSELHDIKGPHFVKNQQLPPPPIAKIDLKSASPAVKRELDKYMKSWKASNQEYQKAAPTEAKEIKDKMVEDNKKFKERMIIDYGVPF